MTENNKIIHIHAKSKVYEVFEYIDESRCVDRLKGIRDAFTSCHSVDEDKLSVTTTVVNPELQFH